MIFDVVTLLPEVFPAYLEASILGRAAARGLLRVNLHALRSYADPPHHVTDDTPYGGGSGMVMKVEPIARAVAAVRALAAAEGDEPKVVLLSPQGEAFSDRLARELAAERRLLLLCGRYEGVDERVRELCVDREISIGDYILTGGELAALALIDAVSRFLPGVLGNEDSPQDESFAGGLLEHPQYTRPREFGSLSVPEVLLGGHHEEIRRWRRREALRRTRARRPDLLAGLPLSEEDRALLEEAGADPGVGRGRP